MLFSVAYLVRGPERAPDDDATIVVDRRDLLTFLQYRANAFEPETFATALDTMPERELERLIDEYVDEEVLYREAKSLNLDASDYNIRRRMVQKMSFLLGDVASAGFSVEEGELEAYFAENKASYAVEPAVTFTHVFFDAERRGAAAAEAAARAALEELDRSGASFNDAPAHGDRFPFLRNYVDRTLDYVAGHFGDEFAAALAELEAAERSWRGPLRSAYGYHVVLLTRRTERRYPDLDEVRDSVERDYLEQRGDAALAEMTQAIRDRYDVRIGDIRPEHAE